MELRETSPSTLNLVGDFGDTLEIITLGGAAQMACLQMQNQAHLGAVRIEIMGVKLKIHLVILVECGSFEFSKYGHVISLTFKFLSW